MLPGQFRHSVVKVFVVPSLNYSQPAAAPVYNKDACPRLVHLSFAGSCIDCNMSQAPALIAMCHATGANSYGSASKSRASKIKKDRTCSSHLSIVAGVLSQICIGDVLGQTSHIYCVVASSKNAGIDLCCSCGLQKNLVWLHIAMHGCISTTCHVARMHCKSAFGRYFAAVVQ